jgi:hypothetical protein
MGDAETVKMLIAETARLTEERDALNALIELAGADIIFFHSQEYGPFIGPETPEIPQKVQFSVMVNDLFVPAADSEGFDISEAIPLRDVFRCDGWEGVVRWVQKKRDNMPLRPHIEKRVREKEIAARCGERTECMKIDWEHKHMTDLRNAIATTDESIISDAQLLAQPGKMFNRIANLERQLAEMTTDRDLWKDDHDGDCPYQTQLAAAQAAIAALKARLVFDRIDPTNPITRCLTLLSDGFINLGKAIEWLDCYIFTGEQQPIADGKGESIYDQSAKFGAKIARMNLENAALKAQVERLKAPVSNEEWVKGYEYSWSSRLFMDKSDINALIAARAAEKGR